MSAITRKICIAILMVILCSLSSSAQRKQPAGQMSRGQTRTSNPRASTARQIAQTVLQSTVLVVLQDKKGKPISQGSGFFFGRGFVATNLHVFKRASMGYVKLINSERTYNISEVVGFDINHDICVFKVDGNSQPGLPIDTSNELAVGDDVYVAGNPKGLEGSFSKGIVSAIRSVQGLIQIDAAISSGSSGGPVVNDRGHVIGIAAASLSSGQNLNFAIPIKYLTRMRLEWNTPVRAAGAIAINGREISRLKGTPEKVTITKTNYATFHLDNRLKHFALPAKIQRIEEFDFAGNLTAQVVFHEGKRIAERTFGEYNELGCANNLTTIMNGKTESKSGMTGSKCLNGKAKNNTFDITEHYILEDGSKLSITHDSNGNLVLEVTLFKDSRVDRKETDFDDNGNPIEQRVLLNGTVSQTKRFTYEFDRYGNWVKQFETIRRAEQAELGFVLNNVTAREITYH